MAVSMTCIAPQFMSPEGYGPGGIWVNGWQPESHLQWSWLTLETEPVLEVLKFHPFSRVMVLVVEMYFEKGVFIYVSYIAKQNISTKAPFPRQ